MCTNGVGLSSPRTLRGLGFPSGDRLHVRTQSHAHVQDTGPQSSPVENANMTADVGPKLPAELVV